MVEWKVTRLITVEGIRNVCIAMNYYTAGTVEEYERLFDYVREHKVLTEEVAEHIAVDIFEHSAIEKLMTVYGVDEKELFSGILFDIYESSYTNIKVK